MSSTSACLTIEFICQACLIIATAVRITAQDVPSLLMSRSVIYECCRLHRLKAQLMRSSISMQAYKGISTRARLVAVACRIHSDCGDSGLQHPHLPLLAADSCRPYLPPVHPSSVVPRLCSTSGRIGARHHSHTGLARTALAGDVRNLVIQAMIFNGKELRQGRWSHDCAC